MILAGYSWAEDTAFFESRVRPVLVKNCYGCHSREAKAAQAGLVLDSKAGLLRGGASGPAIVPGRPDESALIRAIRYDSARKMPPMGKLPDSVIADLTRWVEMGAPDPRSDAATSLPSSIDLEKGRRFWAFQPPKPAAPPTVKNKSWVRNNADRFVLARLEKEAITPVPDADRHTWIRRVTLDLTGLPPTVEETEAFVQDRSEGAFAAVVDRLLASNRFGERWGRHWLDVARYAETMGRTRNYPFPYAWRYRDWVIDAFNADKPYDRFVMEQLAGDLLPASSAEEHNRNLIATGFLALGAHDLNEADRRQFVMDVADEQVSATSKAFLGLTVGCARCHDHKFDPIPTRDYYALAGIFRSTELFNGYRGRAGNGRPFLMLAQLERLEGVPSGESEETTARRRELMGQLRGLRLPRDRVEMQRIARQLGDLPLPANLTMAARDAGQIADAEIAPRGDPHSPGERVPRGVLQVTQPPNAKLEAINASQSGRLQLARWIASRDNPLTARVMVNRIWQHMIGQGIVDTPDNFGASGSRPSHPELLDYLAARFLEQGWSVKKMIREIALSHVYRLSTDHQESAFVKDPGNKLLWRMNRRRLEAEAIRDSILAVSGTLDVAPPMGSPVSSWNPAIDANRRVERRTEDWDRTLHARTVYLPVIRNAGSRFLEAFDFPEPSECRGRRDVTTVPAQALFLMNSPMVVENSAEAAKSTLATIPDDRARVERAYLQSLSRPPSPAELDRALSFVGHDGGADSWARFYQTLFASAEFRYRN
ncbi:MAG: PSD1 and planctomycete cytochrome C domain-containing protein [Bryobacteraceae bacterium]